MSPTIQGPHDCSTVVLTRLPDFLPAAFTMGLVVGAPTLYEPWPDPRLTAQPVSR